MADCLLTAEQTKGYLERIQLPDIAAQVREDGSLDAGLLTVETLDRVAEGHLLNIPFEDLQVHDEHLPLSLEIADLWEKMVAKHRGGYCYEMNGLLHAALQTLGYDIVPCLARVMYNQSDDNLNMHRAELVRMPSGVRYVDVGFGGPMAACSLPVEPGSVTVSGNQQFRLRPMPAEHWWEIELARAGEDDYARVIWFQDIEAMDPQFRVLNFFAEHSPESSFTINRICNIRTKTGNVSLRNLTLTENVDGQKTVTQITEADVPQVLKEKFGIVL